MKQSKLVFPAVMLSGILGVTLTPGWSQTKGGSSGSSGSQTDQGSPSSGSSGMKSSDTGKTRSSDTDKGTSSGAESSAKGSQGQWAKEDIKKVQEALKEKGQDPGPADGVMGAQTQKALRAFQSKNGLKATGRLDAETAKLLLDRALAFARAERIGVIQVTHKVPIHPRVTRLYVMSDD